jgi:hypothetical protein
MRTARGNVRAAVVAVAVVAGAASGQPAANPPASDGFRRPLSTDRPDTTESPYTVEPGRFQVELSFVEWERQDDPDRTDSWSLAPVNLKVGIHPRVDVQLVLQPWLMEDPEAAEPDDGFGDTTVRVKINLWGNERGPTALALMPFISAPTGSDGVSSDHWEGGLIVPFGAELPGGFSLGLMGELDVVHDEPDDGEAYVLVHTATLGHDLVGDLAGFVEYAGAETFSGEGDYEAVLNTGLTYALGPDVQLDGGVGVGLNDAAPDLRVFAGMSFRF